MAVAARGRRIEPVVKPLPWIPRGGPPGNRSPGANNNHTSAKILPPRGRSECGSGQAATAKTTAGGGRPVTGRPIIHSPSAYGYPLLIRGLFRSGMAQAPEQEIVYGN